MGEETRRLVLGLLAAMALVVAYQVIIDKLLPPRPLPPMSASGPASRPQTGRAQPEPGEQFRTTEPATEATGEAYCLVGGEDRTPIVLGGGEGDALRLGLHPIGGGLATLELFARDPKGRFVHRTKPHENQPYGLLAPVNDGQREYYSFSTHCIWVDERGDRSWLLDEVPWSVVAVGPHKAVFNARLTGREGGDDLLRLTKTYTLRPGKPVFDLELAIENPTAGPLTIRVQQDGPIGIRQENPQYDMRRLLTAQQTGGSVHLNASYQWNELKKATLRGEPVRLTVPEKGPLLWTALANKYFAVYTRPLSAESVEPDGGTGSGPALGGGFVIGASGLVLNPEPIVAPGDLLVHGDLLARLVTKATVIQPGGLIRYRLEIYAGPKDAKHLRQVDPAYADTSRLYYQVVQSADTRCFCTFLWLEELMVWLLDKIRLVVRNYGLAIIILVLIIRGLLHPLSVWQQKSMFRMQEVMSRIQPKMEAIRERYPNDKVKQNQEIMRLFADEGVNPVSQFTSFLPLAIQMPILVALWTALNTDVNLRHAPLDGWWIVDLSAPDALLTFNPPITVPILSAIPLIGGVFSNVASLNLLPIVMGVGMWLQQKYMPKPQLKGPAEAARPQSTSSRQRRRGLSPEDQLRQQRIMAYVMAVALPLMFYKMPSGLNLYWLATTVVGICESLLIRKQIEAEKARRQLESPGPRQGRPGLLARFLKHIAAQAEQMQRKADQLARSQPGRRNMPPDQAPDRRERKKT